MLSGVHTEAPGGWLNGSQRVGQECQWVLKLVQECYKEERTRRSPPQVFSKPAVDPFPPVNVINAGLKMRERASSLLTVIEIKHSSGDEWLVTIKASVTTHHRVRVTKQNLEKYAAGRTAKELLQESFGFLLEREPNTSILASFDLPLIARYFPEYEGEIQTRLRHNG